MKANIWRLFCVFCILGFVQNPLQAQFVRGVGGTGTDGATVIRSDSRGMIYIGGVFSDTIDFQPSNTKDLRASRGKTDIFIARYNERQEYRNVLQIGGTGNDTLRTLETDAQGFIYVGGSFEETTDFDPRSTSLNHSSNGQKDAFFAKYDSLGNPIWVRTFGTSGNEEIFDIALDNHENIYVTGVFQNNITFEAGGFPITMRAKGENDGFFIKYNTEGEVEWALSIGSKSDGMDILPNSAMGIAIGQNDAIYVAGTFIGTIDFNLLGSVPRSASGQDRSIYIARYNSNGIFTRQAARIEGKTEGIRLGVNPLHITTSGNIVLTGSFQNQINFGTDNQNILLSSQGQSDAFIVQFTPNLAYDWAIGVGGTNEDLGHGIYADADNNVLATGQFYQSTRVGIGGNLLESPAYGGYLVKLNSNGQVMYSRSVTSDIDGVEVGGFDVSTSTGQNILWAGKFAGTTDFDPSSDIQTIQSQGNSDAFVVKYDAFGNLFRPANCTNTGEKPETLGDSVTCLSQAARIWVEGTPKEGITYLFQESLDSINFKSFGEETSRNTTTYANLSRDMYFRAIVRCEGEETGDTTTIFPVKISDLQVEVGKSPIYAFPNEVITLGENPIARGGSGNYTYSWTPVSFVDNSHIANPKFVSPTLGVFKTQVVISDGACEQVRVIEIRVSTTATEEESIEKHKVINYPNPFSKHTQIPFVLAKPSLVQLKVFRADGQLVYSTQDTFSLGKNQFVFEAQNLPNGVYFYRILGGSLVKTGKMTLIR